MIISVKMIISSTSGGDVSDNNGDGKLSQLCASSLSIYNSSRPPNYYLVNMTEPHYSVTVAEVVI